MIIYKADGSTGKHGQDMEVIELRRCIAGAVIGFKNEDKILIPAHMIIKLYNLLQEGQQ